MPDELIVRPARPGDLSACCRLLEILFGIEEDFIFEADKALAGLTLLVEPSPDHVVYVADAGERVVGMVTVQCLVSTAEGAAAAIVEDMVVDPDHRSQGIGTRLLQAVERWCSARHIERIQLLADSANVPALEFYRACAWQQTRLIALRRRVPAEDRPIATADSMATP